MGRDLNQVSLIGRLVRDPEIKYTANGNPIAKFSIANNYSYIQNNELVEDVNYFDIKVWGNQAVNCEKYLSKGKQIAILGFLKQNKWVDKTSGQNKSKIEITASSIQFLSGIDNDMQKESNDGINFANNQETPKPKNDDIPF